MVLPLLLSVFVVATCGLIYELVSASLASYLLGDSVTQFSTVIGVYLFAMGVGSYLSRFVRKNHLATFVRVELLVGILGGLSSTLLFLAFAHAAWFPVVLYSIVFLVGVGVGLEIPLLMNILREEMDFQELVSRVLSFDYIGALFASVAFPLLFLPNLGLIRTAVLFGIMNVTVALAMTVVFQKKVPMLRTIRYFATAAFVGLVTIFVWGESVLEYAEASVYPDRVIYSANTDYQRIVLSRAPAGIRLHLNNHLQFDSADEYRYHEALVHVGLHATKRKHVLVLGGGDGLAIREVLKYPDVEKITLVDLDPGMTVLFKESPVLSELNEGSLSNPKVEVINADAFTWLRDTNETFDFAVIDFPDPTSFSLGKLYTTAFYNLLKEKLSDDGALAVQSTSPLMARQSYWCVARTLEESGFITNPYHAFVPSFGEWGFVLASKKPMQLSGVFPRELKFITPDLLATLFHFPIDMTRVDVPPNRLNNQVLVRMYEKEWSRYGL